MGQHLTPGCIAKLVGCSEQTVLTFIARGELKATNWGLASRPRWKITPADLQDFLDRRSNQQAPAGPKKPVRKPTKEYV